MKQVSISLSIILLLPVLLSPIFADAPPPTIKFKGLDKDGCKVFELTDKDGLKKGGISRADVTDFGEIKRPTSEPEENAYAFNKDHPPTHQFHHSPSEEKVKITVCPKGHGDDNTLVFHVSAYDSQKPPKETDITVAERTLEFSRGTFVGFFSTEKKLDEKDCKKQAEKRSQTDNIKNPKFDCFQNEKTGKTEVVVSGDLEDPKKPGTAAVVVDPPTEVFLFVLEVCLPTEDGLECPSDVPMDLTVMIDSVVAGKLLPTDSIALFLAGISQSAVWMIPTLAGLAVAGVIIRTKLQRK